MGRLSMHPKCLDFFLLSFGLGGRIFPIFPLFPTCSFQVPTRFPMCSLRVFPIALCFNPICFICCAQSPPLLTYLCGPKGEALHLSIESSILGSLHSFNFFLLWTIKLTHCKKKKVGLVRQPQLIHMKKNKYPQFKRWIDTLFVVGCEDSCIIFPLKTIQKLHISIKNSQNSHKILQEIS
jgi:hypothetical protein